VSGVAVRPAGAAEAGAIWTLMREFAVYERLEREFTGTPEMLARHLARGSWPALDAFLAEADGVPAGYAICYGTFSTFWARPMMWLEDIFVLDRFRGLGAGHALMGAVARLALERGCARIDWAVLDWNRLALDFYERLGARRAGGWQTWRIEGEGLRALAGEPGPDRGGQGRMARSSRDA
jgi:GNAT superfamily N-acetyltransferase